MDKELNKYAKHLKTQSIVNGVAALVLLALMILGVTGVIQPRIDSEKWGGFWNGFISGACFAAFALNVISIILNIRALKKPEYLKKLYIKENDERTMAIMCKAGKKSYFIEAGALGFGIIIGGYFSVAVSITCLVALACLALIRGGLSAYYSKKL